jgi:hypothetical protein
MKMLLSNFTLTFWMLCPQLHMWAQHQKSLGKIGQQHLDDVVVLYDPNPIPNPNPYPF